jgi:DNA-binding NtrC family response regulator
MAPSPPNEEFVAVSASMRQVYALVRQLAATDVTLTLTGETGTGKDVLAHLVHSASPRARAPFVVFDCGAVPPNLVESELFGHERGSFTGAHSDHPGAFERAQGGVLFLDEIGELPLELQPRLLRVLDDHSVRRVGGTGERRVDVRVVAATNRDLGALVAAKHFRQDLYFRLAAAIVQLPPLRDRLEDLPLLVPRLMHDLGRGDWLVPPATLDALRGHSWPGNVRELKNVLACALAFVEAGVVEPHHLRFVSPPSEDAGLERLQLGGHSLVRLERVAIRQTLQQVRGNKAHAAKILGIAPSTLYEKVKKYGL